MEKLTRLLQCRALYSFTHSTGNNLMKLNQIMPNRSISMKQPSLAVIHGHNNSLSLSTSGAFSLLRNLHYSRIVNDKHIDISRVPVLNENDLEESFVRGSGPGGQSVNKTSSACSLRHIPTGFIVKCHETRSLERNRVKARLLMIEKLDDHFNGDMSVSAQKQRLKDEKATKAKQKSRKREKMKQLWKEREGID